MQTTVKQPPPKIEPRLIAPFVNATINVFTTMVKIKPEIIRPCIKQDPGATHDVSGIIGFSGDIVGSVVVTFQMETAQKLVSALVGMEVEANSPDFVDAVGELANMIAGNAKKDLGGVANIAVPTVIVGKNHMIGRLTGVPCVLIPCHTSVGDFAVEVNIKPVATTAS
ncbi:MAG TPA: chemotaxis protein CheX [Tepidisphaeraceae bacterium]|nr:chemotaxis protein CheX [Tepidisphaeraceae bacterium]